MKRWLLITIIVGSIVIVGGVIFVVVISQQKDEEEALFQEATLQELEQQLPLPEDIIEQRQVYTDPAAEDIPGDYQLYWGDQDVENYAIERTVPTTISEEQNEVETIVRTVFPILLSFTQGEDPVEDSIGIIADYLTPEITGQLIDEKEQTTFVNSIDAQVDSLLLNKKNETTYEGQITMTFIYYSSRLDPATEELVEETLGQEKKSYTFEVINKNQYWYISVINEQT